MDFNCVVMLWVRHRNIRYLRTKVFLEFRILGVCSLRGLLLFQLLLLVRLFVAICDGLLFQDLGINQLNVEKSKGLLFFNLADDRPHKVELLNMRKFLIASILFEKYLEFLFTFLE